MADPAAMYLALAMALSADPKADMADLARAAHVSRPTLYRAFGNREALVLEVAGYALSTLAACFDGLDEQQDDYREVFRQLLEALAQIGPVGQFLGHIDLNGDPVLAKKLERQASETQRLVGEAQRAGEVRPELSPWWVAQLFDSVVWLAWTGVTEGELARKHAPRLAFDSFWLAVGVRDC